MVILQIIVLSQKMHIMCLQVNTFLEDFRISDTPQVFENCLAAGIDATTHYVGASRSVSAEIFRGGSSDLLEETSDSLTYGFSFEQPFFDAFDLTMGMTYYEIDINDKSLSHLLLVL